MSDFERCHGNEACPRFQGPKGLFFDLLLKQILPFKSKGEISRTLEQQLASRDEITRRMERLITQSRRVNGALHRLVLERPAYRRGWPRLRWRESGRGGAWSSWEQVADSIPSATLRHWYAELHAYVELLNAMAALGAAMTKQFENALTALDRIDELE